MCLSRSNLLLKVPNTADTVNTPNTIILLGGVSTRENLQTGLRGGLWSFSGHQIILTGFRINVGEWDELKRLKAKKGIDNKIHNYCFTVNDMWTWPYEMRVIYTNLS